MKLKFRRIISAGKFIPEVDGLRFIAVFSVVMFHLNEFLNDHDKNIYVQSYDFSFINNLLSHGNLGVPLFFVLSGFILGRPFADSYINAGNKIDLKKYFIRRLTRLEPPYMLIMTFLLIAKVYLISVLTVKEGFYSYLASITYTHNFFYGKGTLPLLNGPAWSLEIEIQFYMIVPLLTHVFSIPNKVSRRLILVFASLFFIIFDYWVVLPFWSILNYFEFFLAGFLLADFYASNSMLFRKSKYDSWIGVFFLVFIWLFKTTDFNNTILKIIWEIAQLSSIFFLFYYVIFHQAIKFLRNAYITNIGGMCYTIYLLHFPIFSMVRDSLLSISFSTNELINTMVYSGILLAIVLFLSSIFFLTVERPCMDKDWYKKIIKS